MTFLGDLVYRLDHWAMHLLLGPDPLIEINRSYTRRTDVDAVSAAFRDGGASRW